MTTVILLDLSYFIFYRYFALHAWWKLAKPDDDLGKPIENNDFREKFIKTFKEKIKEKEWENLYNNKNGSIK